MTWAFLDDHANEHSKQEKIGGAACWYWACGLMYCRRKEDERRRLGERVDFISTAAALTLYADSKARAHITAIVRVNLWEAVDGGYIVHDYHDVYGRKVTPPAEDQQNQPAADQQSQLTPAQLAARRQGGRARAAQASRGPAARFQQSQQPPTSRASSKEPASRASGSGSDSGPGSDLSLKAAAEDLSGSRAETPCPVAAAPTAIGETRVRIPCPKDLALTADQVATLETSGIPGYAVTATTTRFVSKAIADPEDMRTLVAWRKALAAAVAGDWNDVNRRPRPPGEQPSRGPRGAFGGPSQDWPSDADISLREKVRNGAYGSDLQTKLELGQLDAPLARKLIRDLKQQAEDRRREREDSGLVAAGGTLGGMLAKLAGAP